MVQVAVCVRGVGATLAFFRNLNSIGVKSEIGCGHGIFMVSFILTLSGPLYPDLQTVSHVPLDFRNSI